jgi:hypothetical protein
MFFSSHILFNISFNSILTDIDNFFLGFVVLGLPTSIFLLYRKYFLICLKIEKYDFILFIYSIKMRYEKTNNKKGSIYNNRYESI